MTEKSYQDAIQVLRDHFGTQWERVETEGRDEIWPVQNDFQGQMGPKSKTLTDTRGQE
jgi:hypothetical protein